MAFTKDFWAGHSYATGEGCSADEGIVDEFHRQVGYFQPVIDTFDRLDTISIKDNFNRADSTNLGFDWIEAAGDWDINSNNARLVTTSGALNLAYRPTPFADGAIEWTLGATGQSGQKIAFRIQDANNYLALNLNPGFANATFQKITAGVAANIPGGTITVSSFAAGTVYRVGLRGSKLSLDCSAGGQGFCTETAYQTATGFGMSGGSGLPATALWNELNWYAADTGFTGIGVQRGIWGIENNELRLIAGERVGTSGGNMLGWEAGYSDGEFSYRVGSPGGDNNTNFAFRIVDDLNFCYLQQSSVSSMAVHQVVAGVDTVVNSTTGAAAVLINNDPGTFFRVVCIGPLIRLQSGSGDIAEYIITANQTGTKFGPWRSNAGPSRWDSMRASRSVNLATSGASVGQGQGIVKPLQNWPRFDPDTLVGIIFGINDAIVDVNPRGQKTFQNGMRELISRALTKVVHEDTDSTVLYGGAWSLVASTANNSGAGYHSTTAVGATITIQTPTTFGGGPVSLVFLGQFDDDGGQADIVVNGSAFGSVNTDGLYTTPFTSIGRVCVRITNLDPGSNTIVITTTAISSSFIFDYWAEEFASQLESPTVLVADVARLETYSGGWAAITDADVAQYNVWLAQVLAEFDSDVVKLVGMDAALNANPDLMGGLHPNDEGADVVAAAFLAKYLEGSTTDLDDFQYSYNDLTLGAFTPYELQSLDGLDSLPNIRSGSVDRFGQHGGVAGRHYQSIRYISATFDIFDPTDNEVEFAARRIALQTAFAVRTDPLDVLPLIFKHPGRDRMRVYCRPVDRTTPTDRMFSIGFGQVSVRLEATDVYIYADEEQSIVVNPGSTSGGMSFPLTFPLHFGTGSDGSEQAVNDGTADAPWTATVIGETPNPKITHVESGRWLELSGMTVMAGDTLEFDSKRRTILYNGTSSRRGLLTSASQWFFLQPGINTIQFSSGGVTTGQLTFRWRDTYWSD